MTDAIRDSLSRGIQALIAGQEADGSWRVPLESDASVTAFALLLRQYLGRLPNAEALCDFVSYFHATQSADGGWPLYPGGPDSPDASVLVYAALKVCGVPSGDPVLIAARSAISRMGGLDSLCQPARTVLALLGQLPAAHLPYGSVRLLHEHQGRHPFLDLMSILALGSVVMMRLGTSAAVRPLPEGLVLSELRSDKPSRRGSMEIPDLPPRGFRCGRISRFFWSMSRVLDKWIPVSDAENQADQWLLRQQGRDGSFTGMLLPTGFALAALDQLPGEHEAAINLGLEGWSLFEMRDRRGAWYQFSLASAHDTAQALRALWDYSEDASLQPALRAREFLVSQFQAVTAEGYGGWTFGSFGPRDTDSTAIVLWALLPFQALSPTVVDRGVSWLLRMQSYNGGWAPYSAVTGPVTALIAGGLFPGYADLPDVDVTGRVLRVLGTVRRGGNDDSHLGQAILSGLEFIRRHQKADGSWSARWTLPYIYGTAELLRTLTICGVGPNEPWVCRARDWLTAQQNPDGGWGESHQSFTQGRYVTGPSHPGTTAVALLALLETPADRTDSIARGVAYLLSSQQSDGAWSDPAWLGVVIPGYQYYCLGFTTTCLALQALASAAAL